MKRNILTIKQKKKREVVRGKDLSAPLYRAKLAVCCDIFNIV